MSLQPASPHPYAKRAGPIILAALALFVLLQAHAKAIDPIIDAGRDLYIAGQLAEGQTLYTDLVYYYPPAGPYVLALFVALFGNSLLAFELFGAAVGMASLVLLYAIARRCGGEMAAFIAGLLFVSLNFAGASTWGANFLFPYAHGTTLGILFTLLFTWGLLCYAGAGEMAAGTRSPWTFALIVVSGILAALSKLEYAMAVGILSLSFAILHRVPLRHLVMAIAAVLATLLSLSSVFGESPFALGWMGDRLLSSSLLGAESTKNFYAEVSGISDWPRNFGLSAAGAAAILLLCGLFAVIDRRRARPVADPLIILLLFASSVLIWILADGLFFRAWVILQIALAIYLLLNERQSPLLLLVILSIASTVRIAFNLTPEWYGFALMLPVYLVIVCTLFRFLPARGIYGTRTALLWLPLFGVLAARGLVQQYERYEMKRFPVETSRGRFFDASVDRAMVLSQFLAFLRERGAETLVVMPEGVSLNYFSGVPTPLSRYAFIPPETSDPAVEEEAIAAMKRTRPELVAIVTRDMREFGSAGFGVDYNQRLHRYVTTNYVVERAWVLRGFQLILLRRG